MTRTTVADGEESKEPRLPKRDWIVIPGIGLLTVLLLAAGTELIARHIYSHYDRGKENCRIYDDPYIGVRRLASCDYWTKAVDTQPIEFRLNSRGYREASDFPPKSPGTYRIVLVGSSYAWGGESSREKSIAGLLPAELSRLTGKKVELYNESIPGFPGLPQNLDKRFPDVLAAQPDLILWVTTRWDIKAVETTEPDPDGLIDDQGKPVVGNDAGPQAPQDLRTTLTELPRSLASQVKDIFTGSSSAILLQQLLYISPQQVAGHSLVGPDDIIGYLKADLSPAWEDRLSRFNGYASDIAAQSHAAGASLVMVMMPTADQAAMISTDEWPSGFDPFKLDNELKAIIDSHGGVYLDILPDYRNIPDPQRGFSMTARHPNSVGEAILTNLMAQKLTDGSIPALTRSAGSQVAQRQAE